MRPPVSGHPGTGWAARPGMMLGLGLALICALIALLAVGGQSAAAADALARLPHVDGGLDVLPFPGTPDAAPATRISLPALAPGAIASVSVRGSRSGRHVGRLVAQSGGPGSVFVPARPFAAGERVSVRVLLKSAAAGAAAGAPGQRLIRFSFTIARP